MNNQLKTDEALQTFLQEQQLPRQFLQQINDWYTPLATQLAQHHDHAGRSLLIGINGSQGSGKSTLASLLTLLLTQVHQLKAIDLSIDDFYLTRQSRHALANHVHPLLKTRGVPGTHDTILMYETLKRLIQPGNVPIPRFDKASDDRYPADQWDTVSAPLDIVIIEGWCLGTPPQSDEALLKPINTLEAEEDSASRWRQYANQQIGEQYEAIYKMIDIWIMLQAPSFDCIYQWRREQENKLAKHRNDDSHFSQATSQIMSDQQIARFIQHYQRLTEHTLKVLPDRVHYLYKLDQDRHIIAADQPMKVNLP